MSCDSANAGCALRETILILVLLYRSEACLANYHVEHGFAAYPEKPLDRRFFDFIKTIIHARRFIKSRLP
jgi:hypothetical protein